MLRGPFNVAASLSLLLCLFLICVWHLTRHAPRSCEFAYKGVLYRLTTHAGDFQVDNEPQRTIESHPLRLLVSSIRSIGAKSHRMNRRCTSWL